jgi:hypothetical protein
LLAHVVAAVAIAVEADATVVRWLPLQIHHHCRLRPHHIEECWSGPCPLPPTDRCSQTPTPIKGVIRASRMSSTVGTAPNGLHRSMTLHHRAIKRRRREVKKMKMTSARSRWSPTPSRRRRYTVGSEKSMRQPATLSVCPPRRPIWERLSARFMALDSRAKPVSGPRKRGSIVEEEEQAEKVWHRRRSQGGRVGGGGLDLVPVSHHNR